MTEPMTDERRAEQHLLDQGSWTWRETMTGYVVGTELNKRLLAADMVIRVGRRECCWWCGREGVRMAREAELCSTGRSAAVYWFEVPICEACHTARSRALMRQIR
jgi:hypothetical protein